MLGFGAVASLLAAFAWIADEVREGSTQTMDAWLLMALRNPVDASVPMGPAWLVQMARDITALGSIGVLGLVAAAAASFLVVGRWYRAAMVFAGSIAGGWLLVELLKHIFQRARPDLVPHGAVVFTTSFPSSHAAMSAVVYLTLSALLARLVNNRRLKLHVIASAVFLTVLVGLSRVYLAVHWPSDVLAGWVIGSSWALLCWTAMRWLQRRGEVEAPQPVGVSADPARLTEPSPAPAIPAPPSPALSR